VPLDDLELEGWEIAGYFYGSNIQPEDEYVKRLEALNILINEHKDIKVINGEYEPETWREHMQNLNLLQEPEGGLRCAECFRLQFEAAAREAVKLNCTHISTSLTISPHKNVNLIIKIGEEIAAKYNLIWLPIAAGSSRERYSLAWARMALSSLSENRIRYDKSVQSYTKLYYLYYGTLTICLPVSSNPILLMLLSFGAALHRL